MKNFDRYEFIAVVVPGAILLGGVALAFPETRPLLVSKDVSFGSFGLFVVLAFVVGHLGQGLGNLLEAAYFLLWRGLPTDWLRESKHMHRWVISPELRARVLEAAVARKWIGSSDEPSESSWKTMVASMAAAVRRGGQARRLDTFNANYGLNRGMASALLLASTLAFVFGDWRYATALLVLAALALYRMHRFGRTFARELFVQFDQIPAGSASPATSPTPNPTSPGAPP